MSVDSVSISSDALMVCLSHALSTETEEIMGLLLGDVIRNGDEVQTRIWSVSNHRRETAARSDDRVEINPEQLAAAAQEAEKLSEELGLHTRVVGWYHSHPHLAVVPSHVDLGTQAMYQQMDSGFVGLIFSVFNHGKIVPGVPTGTQVALDNGVLETSMGKIDHVGRIQLTAFQSRYKNASGDTIPAPPPQCLSNSDGTPMTPISNETSQANAALQGAQSIRYEHKELTIHVTPQGCMIPSDKPRSIPCLSKLSRLQRIMQQEEQSAFLKSIGIAPSSSVTSEATSYTSSCHPLVTAHNSGVYQKSLCRLMEACQLPLITSVKDRISATEVRVANLRKDKEAALAHLQKLKDTHKNTTQPAPAELNTQPTQTLASSRTYTKETHGVSRDLPPIIPAVSFPEFFSDAPTPPHSEEKLLRITDTLMPPPPVHCPEEFSDVHSADEASHVWNPYAHHMPITGEPVTGELVACEEREEEVAAQALRMFGGSGGQIV